MTGEVTSGSHGWRGEERAARITIDQLDDLFRLEATALRNDIGSAAHEVASGEKTPPPWDSGAG